MNPDPQPGLDQKRSLRGYSVRIHSTGTKYADCAFFITSKECVLLKISGSDRIPTSASTNIFHGDPYGWHIHKICIRSEITIISP